MTLVKEWNHNSDSIKKKEKKREWLGHQKMWGYPGRQKVGWEGSHHLNTRHNRCCSWNKLETSLALWYQWTAESREGLYGNQVNYLRNSLDQQAGKVLTLLSGITEHEGPNLCLLGWSFITILTKMGSYLDKGWCMGVCAERRTKSRVCLYFT